ncbi:hypothetical protein QCE47_05905 [Caballeronia sp. LZ025]|uniref:hypothetical protein n=1 Tax=Caballeronia TaxID=1827195 RepID=UPI001FD03AB1|nr:MULTISPECIES: hypothetical protein [Caballeronia]MDR5731881.1 hypothetical protein [Caballeronia sp. LZ025]
MRLKPSLLLLCGVIAIISPALAQRLPDFQDCPRAVQSIEKTPRLNFPDAQTRKYRSVLRDAANGPVGFAGHFVLAESGCGAGCVMAAAIDKQSGRIVPLPFTVSDWPLDVDEPIEYRANSCMVIVKGSRNESNEHGTYYYAFDGTSFHLRATAPRQ